MKVHRVLENCGGDTHFSDLFYLLVGTVCRRLSLGFWLLIVLHCLWCAMTVQQAFFFLYLFRDVHGQYPVVTPATKQYLQQFEAQSRKSKIKNKAIFVKVVVLQNFACQCYEIIN